MREHAQYEFRIKVHASVNGVLILFAHRTSLWKVAKYR